MEINILLYHLDQGGVEKTAVELANELVEMGHDVTISTIYKHKPEIFEIDPRIKLKRFIGFYIKGMDRLMNLVSRKFLYKKIIKKEYDIEIAFQASLPTEIVSSSSNQDSKKYAWIHGIGMEYSDLYHSFDTIFFVGEDIKRHYTHVFKDFDLSKLNVLYNAINREKIIELSNETPIKVDTNTIGIVSVGRLSSEKRFDRLIQSLKLLIQDGHTNLELTIVGEGDERIKLEKLISDLELVNEVNLVGFNKNPYNIIKNNDIYVCSSDYEGFNVAMNEAAILGLPIVSTNVYGSKELLGENNDFGLVSDLTVESLKEKIAAMLDLETRQEYSSKISIRVDSFIKKRKEIIDKYFKVSL